MSTIDILRVLLVAIPLVFAIQTITDKHISKRILGVILINISIYFLIYIILLQNFHIIGVIIHSVLLLAILPLLFLYTKSLVFFNFSLDKKKIVHFAPSFILAKFAIIFLIINNYYSINSALVFYYHYYISIGIYAVQILMYSFFIIRLFYIHKENIKTFFSLYYHKNNLKWLKVFLIFFISIIFYDIFLTIIDNTIYEQLKMVESFFNFFYFYYIL